jgi:hypothetical protein
VSEEHALIPVVTEEVVAFRVRKYRRQIPEAHSVSLDTRIKWLWHQRFGTVQTVYTSSPDILDRTAATLIIQAIMAKDLDAISQIFQRIEGGAIEDVIVQERAQVEMRL